MVEKRRFDDDKSSRWFRGDAWRLTLSGQLINPARLLPGPCCRSGGLSELQPTITRIVYLNIYRKQREEGEREREKKDERKRMNGRPRLNGEECSFHRV